MDTNTNSSEIIETLAAIEAIKNLKFRYFRSLDQELFNEVEACFTDDGIIDYGVAGSYDNIADFVAMIRDYAKTNSARGIHQGYNPEIEVNGDTATGCWVCSYLSVDTEQGVSYKQTGVYQDTYRKADGQWRIQSTRNSPLFNETISQADDTVSVVLG